MEITFETLPEHPESEKFKQLAEPPGFGEKLNRFVVGRTKCVSTWRLIVIKLKKNTFGKELKIIPHPKSFRVCWVVEIIEQTLRKPCLY